MSNNKTVLVIGTGTIGEPLIGLLARRKSDLGIDRVIFHKRTPLDYEVAKVNSLVNQGADLAVNSGLEEAFKKLGHKPKLTFDEALQLSSVVIDCTPAGNENKEIHYYDIAYADGLGTKSPLFVAQGSEKGFGTPYAYGLNDEVLHGNALTKANEKFIQVVSCNTHAIGRLISTLTSDKPDRLVSGDFVCIRRSNDTSQDDGFTPSPTCGNHTDETFGTHHARDVSDLFETVTGKALNLRSSAMKVNSQYMHVVRFTITLNEEMSAEEVTHRFKDDKFVTLTKHKTANKVFSFGRDHGFYGRIYNHVVVCQPSVSVFPRGSHKGSVVTGFAFTPQDGNSLLSSVVTALYGVHQEKYVDYLDVLEMLLQDEV